MTNEELKSFYFGAYRFSETPDGYLMAHQYTKKQEEYFRGKDLYWFERCNASNAKTIEFISGAEEVSFRYRFYWRGSEDSIELWVDGRPFVITKVSDLPKEGTLVYPIPGGNTEKKMILYLPSDSTLLIRDFTIAAPAVPPVKKKKILWMGDSITQGYGPMRSAMTYVSVANRMLDYDVINQGIGGYIYDAGSVSEMPGYRPDEIFVSLGTNQFEENSHKSVEAFYVKLREVYTDTVPVTCITPVWRTDLSEREFEKFIRFCDGIKNVCKKYDNIKVTDGFELIPHSPEYYIDGLHPNEKGTAEYGRNLVHSYLDMLK